MELLEELKKQIQDLSNRVSVLERQNKNMLLIGDVAELTGLSKSTIYKLTCSNKIPHYKPNGKHIYFERIEIENWMKCNHIGCEIEI